MRSLAGRTDADRRWPAQGGHLPLAARPSTRAGEERRGPGATGAPQTERAREYRLAAREGAGGPQSERAGPELRPGAGGRAGTDDDGQRAAPASRGTCAAEQWTAQAAKG